MDASDASKRINFMYGLVGFDEDTTQGIDYLKQLQNDITTKVNVIVQRYGELKDKKVDDEDDEDSLTNLNAQQEYSDDRMQIFDDLRLFYFISGVTIRCCVDEKSEIRVKRVHVFVENSKKKLRKTQPLGEEELDRNAIWLAMTTEKFSEEVIPKGSLEFKPLAPAEPAQPPQRNFTNFKNEVASTVKRMARSPEARPQYLYNVNGQ